jgi:uncharacterized membrane protein YecN with MAPEG domain
MNGTHAVVVSISVLALLITALSIQVSRLRLRHRVSFGDGGHKDLLVAVRAHGNALEQTALFAMLALGCLALPGTPGGLLAGCAAVFTAARLVHAAAIFGRRLVVRQAAHVASTLVHVLLAATILWTVGR